MSDLTLSPSLIAFGNALARLAGRLRAELANPLPGFGVQYAVACETLNQHFDTLESVIARIMHRLDAMNSDVLANQDASEADAHRAVGLLEAEIDRLIEGRAAATHIVAPPLTHDARRLLPAVYTHTLREILAWLDDLVPLLTAPRATLEARGQWNKGHPLQEIEICLTLTAAPELLTLQAQIAALGEDDLLDALDAHAAGDIRRNSLCGHLSRHRRSSTPGVQLLDAVFDAVWFAIQIGLLAFGALVLLGIATSFF